MRIAFIVGTSAELLKMVGMIFEFRRLNMDVVILDTGQASQELMDEAKAWGLSEILIFDNSRSRISSLITSVGWFLNKIFKVRLPQAVSMVVIHGDTLSTLVGAWWGFISRTPVCHVEAGLRSKRLFSPFPEEITRRLVSGLATWHICPSDLAVENLISSNIPAKVIFNSKGNTVVDTWLRARALNPGPIPKSNSPQKMVIVNFHRFENVENPGRIDFLLRLLDDLSDRVDKIIIIKHKAVFSVLLKHQGFSNYLKSNNKCRIEERMCFHEFSTLVFGSCLLVSDGGSNQEECAFLGIPMLILRQETERDDGLREGVCFLSKFDWDRSKTFIDLVFDNPSSVGCRGGDLQLIQGESPSRRAVEFLCDEVLCREA